MTLVLFCLCCALDGPGVQLSLQCDSGGVNGVHMTVVVNCER